MKRFFPVTLALAMFTIIQPAKAVDPDPAVMAFTLPDQIKWTGREGGPKTALLFGDPTKPELYIELLKWPPHTGSRPHSHPNDRFIYVISGTWYVGSGPNYDPDHMAPMPAGTFIRHYGKQTHYDGAKDGEVVLEMVGIGPASAPRGQQP